MLYELTPEPPQPGSLLESVFTLFSKRRQQSEYHKTRVLMLSPLADKLEGGTKMLEEALEDYRVSVFPYLASERQKEDKSHKKVLKQWTNKVLKIRPLWRAQENKGVVSKLRRGKEKLQKVREKRKQQSHRRI